MTQSNADVLQGTLDMLILKTLLLEPMHGWGFRYRQGCNLLIKRVLCIYPHAPSPRSESDSRGPKHMSAEEPGLPAVRSCAVLSDS